MDIISLGRAAGKIAGKFAQYPEYIIYNVDIEKGTGNHTLVLPEFKTPEEYEENCGFFDVFFKDMQGEEVLFLCVGSSPITGCSLKLLEALKHKKITVLYIRPDIGLLSEKAVLQERVTSNVFQQYARSGLFERIYLVDNVRLEEILGDIPIVSYYEKLNDLISSTFHMINVYKHIKPVMESKIEIPIISRIATFGIHDNNSGEDKFFYPLSFITNQIYYYAFNKEILERDGKIFQKIKKEIKERTAQNTKIFFGIYSTEYKDNYVFCEGYTHFVQDEKV